MALVITFQKVYLYLCAYSYECSSFIKLAHIN